MFKKFRKKSPWVLHYNAGSCNGCDIELLAALGPKYDLERFGILNNGNPKQSDILLVTGPVTYRSRERLVELYSMMAEPKVVVTVGVCTCTGGVFREMYNVEAGVDRGEEKRKTSHGIPDLLTTQNQRVVRPHGSHVRSERRPLSLPPRPHPARRPPHHNFTPNPTSPSPSPPPRIPRNP